MFLSFEFVIDSLPSAVLTKIHLPSTVIFSLQITPRCWYMKSGTTPSWLESFAARKKPKLERQAVAALEVDVSTATCYMAEEHGGIPERWERASQ